MSVETLQTLSTALGGVGIFMMSVIIVLPFTHVFARLMEKLSKHLSHSINRSSIPLYLKIPL